MITPDNHWLPEACAVSCPKCGQPALQRCCTAATENRPSRTTNTHAARITAYVAHTRSTP